MIIFALVFVFLVITAYYLTNVMPVNSVDLVFAVVVGWLGLIIGRFFGEAVMETLNQSRKLSNENMTNKMEKLIYVNKKQREIINQYQNKLIDKK